MHCFSKFNTKGEKNSTPNKRTAHIDSIKNQKKYNPK